jgi:hypothetical protein
MKKWSVIAGCAAIALVVLGLTFFRSSDEDKVRKTLVTFGQIVMVKEGDTIISRTARLRDRLKDVVDDDVRVNVSELNIDVRGRPKLEEDAAKAGLLYAKADVDFTNVVIKIDPQVTMATVDAVALVTATRGGERQVDKRDVHFLLRKDGVIGGIIDWKITTIDVAAKKPE